MTQQAKRLTSLLDSMQVLVPCLQYFSSSCCWAARQPTMLGSEAGEHSLAAAKQAAALWQATAGAVTACCSGWDHRLVALSPARKAKRFYLPCSLLLSHPIGADHLFICGRVCRLRSHHSSASHLHRSEALRACQRPQQRTG